MQNSISNMYDTIFIYIIYYIKYIYYVNIELKLLLR